MSRFGWAYVNDVITGSGGTPGGSDKAIQFASGSTFSGSTNFTYNYLSNSLAQGLNTLASGSYSHAEGTSTIAYGDYSHAEGINTRTYAYYSHAEGQGAWAYGTSSHAEGASTTTYGTASHAEGRNTITYGNYSHAEGIYTLASGDYSHTEGIFATASANSSHAEGAYTLTEGIASHAEGESTIAYGDYSHAEGLFTVASGTHSHVEGEATITYGDYSHAEGYATKTYSQYSHAGGLGTIASASGQTVVGKYNVANSSSLFIVGNGVSNASRSDIFLVNSNNITISGALLMSGTSYISGTVSSSIALQTAGTITAASNITSTGGILSASSGIDTAGPIRTSNGLFAVGAVIATGSIITLGTFSGDGSNITDINGINVNGVGNDWTIQLKDGNTGTLTGSSNLTFSGSTLTLTGSFLMTGSSTFINIGPTILSGTLNVTGAITGNNAFISGGLSVGNYIQMLPVAPAVIPTNQTASYIYTSGSTNDIYFTQYLPGTSYTNTTRLRWLESSIATGHQHGGILSTVTGTTTFSLTAGSGLIVDQNVSLTADSYPTIIKVDWPAYVSQSLDYISSSQVTYISINASGTIQQSTTAPTITQYRDRIILGRVLHQTGSVTNGVLVIPAVTYGSTNNLLDFTRAFGPLKISGHVLAASGSTLSLTKTAGDSYAEGRNYTSDPESPNIITSANDAALTVSKIYRQYLNVSGNIVTDTGIGLAGHTTIDPTQYNTGGTLAAVGNSEWTNQRVYWFPKAVNRALFVYYGQEKYPTFSDALAAISVETFTEGSNTAGSAIFVGTITVRGNASSLTATDARITPSGLHRGASGGGGGGGGQTSAAGSNGYVQYNDSGVLGAESTFTYDSTSNTLSVTNISASSYVGGIPKHAIFYANGVTTGSNYELLTINSNKYLQLQRRKTFPTARAIGLMNSEYGWTWLNRSSLSSVSSSTENVSSSNAANLIHSSLSDTTWFGGTATAPTRYREYNLQVGQSLQVTTKISAYSVSNYDQTQAVVWISGSVDKYVRFGVGYDNGLYATAQSNLGGTTNHTLTSGEAAAGIWWTAYITPTQYSLYYNLSTGSTLPTTGWLFSQGNTFVNASVTSVGNKINVGQMLMTGKSNAAITSTGSFHYYDVQLKPDEEAGYFVPNSYYRWGSAQYDTSGTEQLVGEFDLGSTSATIDQTKLRLALADLVNNLSGDSATVTWSAVQSSSSGASSSTYYDASSVVISGTGRYFRLWAKVTSTGNTGGSIGPFPITIPIS